MFNWKIVATIFITLGILVIFLASSPQLGNFFESLKGKISDLTPEQQVDRNISFLLDSETANITTPAKDVIIELTTDNFTAQLKDVNVNFRGKARILGFSGALAVNNKRLSLDGSFKKVELETTSLTFPQGSLKSTLQFENLSVDNLALRELVVPKSRLTINSVATDSDSEIRISSPLGRFEFTSGLKATGKANKISIPEAKIFVG